MPQDTDINMEAAKTLIRVEPRVTTREIQDCLSIGAAATVFILQVSSLKGGSLTNEQRAGRVEWCEFMLQKLIGDC